jgi:hypothetical protein
MFDAADARAVTTFWSAATIAALDVDEEKVKNHAQSQKASRYRAGQPPRPNAARIAALLFPKDEGPSLLTSCYQIVTTAADIYV